MRDLFAADPQRFQKFSLRHADILFDYSKNRVTVETMELLCDLPLLVREIFNIIQRINQERGVTILLVEQNARLALGIADYAFIMESGRIVLEGEPAVLADNPDVREFYLGLTEEGKRKSYRDVKHYKRRKRWLS